MFQRKTGLRLHQCPRSLFVSEAYDPEGAADSRPARRPEGENRQPAAVATLLSSWFSRLARHAGYVRSHARPLPVTDLSPRHLQKHSRAAASAERRAAGPERRGERSDTFDDPDLGDGLVTRGAGLPGNRSLCGDQVPKQELDEECRHKPLQSRRGAQQTEHQSDRDKETHDGNG